MAKTRKELQREFAAELFLSASFFKMNRLTSGDKNTPLAKVDAMVNRQSGSERPMNHPLASKRYFPEREKMPKFPKGR